MEGSIANILSADPVKAAEGLQHFVDAAAQTFAFPELSNTSKRKNLWTALYHQANSSTDAKTLINCFSAIRILSREKTSINEVITQEWLDLINKHSGLVGEGFVFNADKEAVAVEAQKALCNVIFHSSVAAALACKNGTLEAITQRMKKFKDNSLPEDIKFFDMKVLFLITALCSEVRLRMKEELHGVTYLIETLDLILKQAAENVPHNADVPQICLNDKQVDLTCEILKALFNLTIDIDGNDEEEGAHATRLVSTLRIYLLIPTCSKEKTSMLQSNVINLLTNMPSQCNKNLYTSIQSDQKVPAKLRFEDQNMTAVYEILMFLKDKFSDEPTVSKQHEMLSPVVSVLLKCANSDRPIRKYLRSQILPPLRDVHSRPEQGTTLRNCLCRLLTTPITQLRDLVAELLFVLVKKNVNRMIKYTGYGNAAGLFAQRGLLGGRPDEGEADFSPDSQDSETEEYAEYKHGINPVIGCYEEPHPNVMDNMTEEQKEYEAMKLVELMDNLTRCGAIRPCRVGADGKPHPIEHVLQLQEGLKSQQVNNPDSDTE